MHWELTIERNLVDKTFGSLDFITKLKLKKILGRFDHQKF
jgi:hypothetical protein